MNWGHLKTIVWLRWRMNRNRFKRAGTFENVLRVLILVITALACAGGAVLGFLGGLLGLAEADGDAFLFVFDLLVAVFLLFWMIGLLTELQRSESIDLTRLLHLPIGLKEGFVFNYLAALAAPSIYLITASGLGLTLGLMVSRGPLLALVFLPVTGLVFFVSAWTYCLRGWIAGWMNNPRRRKTVIMVATLSAVLIFQLPNIFIQWNLRSGHGKNAEKTSPGRAFKELAGNRRVLLGHAVLPFGWPGVGARALAEGRPAPVLLTLLGSLALGGTGLLVSLRGARRLYAGGGGAKAGEAENKPRPRARAPREDFVARELPFLRGDTAALALANFRSLTRAPEVRVALISYLVVMVVIGVTTVGRATGEAPAPLKLFLPSGLAIFTVFSIMQVVGNQFGFDRDGFRALVLLPLPRAQILFAKNLSFIPIVLGLGWIVLPLVAIFVRLPPTTLLAGMIHLLTIYCLVSILGNYSSITAPYKVSAGALKKSKPPAKVVFIMMGVFIATPIFAIPVLIPPLIELLQSFLFGTENVPFNLILSVVMLAIAGLIYRLSLTPMGRLLQTREQQILQAVCQENA